MSVCIHESVDTSIYLHDTQKQENNQSFVSAKQRRYYSCIQCEYYNLDKDQLKSDICRCQKQKGSTLCDKCQFEQCQCLNEFVYNLCEECMEKVHSFDVDAVNDSKDDDIRNSLYFVLHDGDVGGPYSISEIIRLYVCRKFSKNQIQIMSAAKEECWAHFDFPNHIMADIIHECILCTLTQNCAKTRDEIDTHEQKVLNAQSCGIYQYIYKRLVIDVLKGELKQVIIPKKEPQYNHTLIWLLGIIAVTLFTAILIAHTLISLIVALIFAKLFSVIRKCCSCGEDLFWNHRELIHNVILFIAYSGIAICPILVSFGILDHMQQFNGEVQSWMLAYMCWGVLSFKTSLAYFLAEILGLEHRIPHSVSWFMFLVIGLDFGQIDIFDAFACSHVDITKLIFSDSLKHKMVQITILFLFPCLFSLLPALVVGFAANFVLEEKFLLRCGHEIDDAGNGLCFDDAYGCCRVLSSHDLGSSYLFIGGVGSTCVTLWGFIRINAYLISSAFPTLSTYSKRIQRNA